MYCEFSSSLYTSTGSLPFGEFSLNITQISAGIFIPKDRYDLMHTYRCYPAFQNRGLYDERKDWYPDDFEEYIIEGANHAQYGDYGEQPRDNEALISAESQQKQTADIILKWLEER